MTRQVLGNDATSMVADGTDLVMERVFDAPRELVWAAMTTPEHITHWWGPRGTSTVVEEMDVRPGGRWRWIHVYEGGQAPFSGEYLEVVPPERFVRTSVFDADPDAQDPAVVETVTLEEAGGKTAVRWHARFPSAEVLDFAISTGMSEGVLQQFDRLAELLSEMD